LVKREVTISDIATRPLVLGLLLGQIVLWWLLPVVVATVA